jgi:hypothetical protein
MSKKRKSRDLTTLWTLGDGGGGKRRKGKKRGRKKKATVKFQRMMARANRLIAVGEFRKAEEVTFCFGFSHTHTYIHTYTQIDTSWIVCN